MPNICMTLIYLYFNICLATTIISVLTFNPNENTDSLRDRLPQKVESQVLSRVSTGRNSSNSPLKLCSPMLTKTTST